MKGMSIVLWRRKGRWSNIAKSYNIYGNYISKIRRQDKNVAKVQQIQEELC